MTTDTRTTTGAAACCLLGIVAVLLPWYSLRIFGTSAAINGFEVWQGKVTAAVFTAVGLVVTLAALGRLSAQGRSWWLVASGVVVILVAGWYVWSIVFPEPTTIHVNQGGQVAQAVAQDLVKNMDGNLSFGAPLAIAMGLGLFGFGAWELISRGRKSASAD